MPRGPKFSLPHRMCRNCGLAHFSVIPPSLAYVFLYCRGWSCPVAQLLDVIWKKERKKVKLLSHVWLSATPWTVACQAPPSMGSPGKNTGVGYHFLLQGIIPTQGLNLGLPQCRQTLNCQPTWPIRCTHMKLDLGTEVKGRQERVRWELEQCWHGSGTSSWSNDLFQQVAVTWASWYTRLSLAVCQILRTSPDCLYRGLAIGKGYLI